MKVSTETILNKISEKTRADIALVKIGLAPSREKASALILAGEVFVNSREVKKSSEILVPEDEIVLKYDYDKYVSRGGYKLEQALDYFGILPSGKVAMDVGASTGGFTDCMLRRGAYQVIAIDVGTNQLAWKLRSDDRVLSLEQTNFRTFDNPDFKSSIDLITVDLSFISLRLVFEKIIEYLTPDGEVICLIKPQFEANKGMTKKGKINNEEQRKEILEKIFLEAQKWFQVIGFIESDTPGKKKKNIEYLAYFRPRKDLEL